MKNKLCKVCEISKPLTEFHKCKLIKCGYESRCKACKKIGRKIITNAPKVNKKHQQNWDHYFRLVNPTKNDYMLFYQFIERLGYDLTKDIHIQFCEKHNLRPKKGRNLRNQNHYLPDGSTNILYKTNKKV